MSWKKQVLILVLCLMLTFAAGCKKLIPSHFEIETTSELGPDTLGRIDDLNDTLATGMEIGPETRATIEELNKTIDEGLEFGFTDSTLQRVDVLLNMVEQGVGIKAGLDAETNRTVNNLINTLDDQPGQWEDTLTEIITTLEGSSARVAEQMADEVQGLMVEARLNTQQLSASMGAEFRCNVDFMSTRAGDTLDQFIGRSLKDRLRSIITGEELEEEAPEIPIPQVCQMVPDQIDLEESDDQIVFDSLIKISGYNFVEENKPIAHIANPNGEPISSIQLYPPLLSTSYQVQINLQGIDFSQVPPGSMVVLEWPTVEAMSGLSRNELSILLPSQEEKPTEEVIPQLTINVDEVVVRKGPGEEYFSYPSKAVRGAKYEILGHNGDGSWWQIDFERDPGWVRDADVTTSHEELVGTASSIPIAPVADFQIGGEGHKAGEEVNFLDQSTGEIMHWTWEVLPEDSTDVFRVESRDLTYTFPGEGAYLVKLLVENEFAADEKTVTVEIESEGVTLVLPGISQDFAARPLPTATPKYNRPILFKNFVWRKQDVKIPTGVSANDYNCGVISLAAMHGDIEEHDAGNVIKVWLETGAAVAPNEWVLSANFRTHNNHENWSLGIMCVERGLSFFDQVELNDPDTITGEINISPLYTCGIAGFDITNVNVEDDSAGDIIQVFTRPEIEEGKLTGTWEVTADFMEEGGQEGRVVQVLCFYNNQAKVLTRRLEYFEGGERATGIPVNRYACGISGLRALDGEVKEDNKGDIIKVYTYHNTQDWWVYANFRSENQAEKWVVDLTCVDRSIANFVESDWYGNWIRP